MMTWLIGVLLYLAISNLTLGILSEDLAPNWRGRVQLGLAWVITPGLIVLTVITGGRETIQALREDIKELYSRDAVKWVLRGDEWHDPGAETR